MHKIGVSVYIGAWSEIGYEDHCVGSAQLAVIKSVPDKAPKTRLYNRD